MKNIYRNKRGRYVVRLNYRKRERYIGSFVTEEEAVAARDRAVADLGRHPEVPYWDMYGEGFIPKGTVVGWLLVGEPFPVVSDGRSRTYYHCTCKCGQRIDVAGSNLRESNPRHTVSCGCKRYAENMEMHRNSKTGVKGVSYVESRGKYTARIFSDGKSRWLGYYDTLEEAAEARKAAEENLREERRKDCE